jgi:tRNA 2-selenouridine synthase SelU
LPGGCRNKGVHGFKAKNECNKYGSLKR